MNKKQLRIVSVIVIIVLFMVRPFVDDEALSTLILIAGAWMGGMLSASFLLKDKQE